MARAVFQSWEISHCRRDQASYTLEGAVLENVDNIKYLGVTITNDLKWNTHIIDICTKANRTFGFLRRNGSSVWDLHPDKLLEELEKVQNRAARFVPRNYVYETGSMTGILGPLKSSWNPLRRG